MPLHRTQSRSSSQRLHQHSPSMDRDVIVLSSDSDTSERISTRKSPLVARRRKGKAKARNPPPPPEEVVEVSSDGDESPPPRRKVRVSNELVEAELPRAKASLSGRKTVAHGIQATNSLCQSSLPTVQAPPSEPSGSQHLPTSGVRLQQDESKRKYETLVKTLDDNLSCDICVGKMWIPSTLSCGHTFCQSCLQDWFNTALVKHLDKHPHYTLHTPRMRQLMHVIQLSRVPYENRRLVELEILAEHLRQPRPDYTCPTCRVPVLSRPVEVFVLKNVVQTVAEATGENAPERYRSQPSISLQDDGPWDGFFPRIRL